jgi:outer membrane protein
MSKFILLAFVLLSLSFNAQAQARIAYVDIEKVLASNPDYERAQKELEEQAELWRQEIAKDYAKIEQLYRDYQAREVLLSEETKKQKQDEIVAKEKDVRELQKKRFGPEGELFQKRQTLVKPIQEKVYQAVKKVAETRNYDFILTAPDGSSVIYAKPDKDLTEEVIKAIK